MTDPADKADGDEAFLARWSRRKAAPEAEAPAVEPVPEPEAEPTPEERERLIAALPPLDSIGPGVDLKPFLARWVPEDLRNAALRRMWVADPAIRDAVGDALDYAFDYNAPETIPGWGPLSPGDSAREVVERIFSGRSDVATALTEDQASPAAGENVNGADREVAGGAPESELTDEARKPPQDYDNVSKPIRRKHGGALPS